MALTLVLAACSDDTTKSMPDSGRPDSEDSTSGTTIEPTGDTSDTSDTSGETTDSTDTSDSSDTSDTSDTGESGDAGDTGEPEPEIPRPAMELASTAVVAFSPNYTMVLTSGQQTANSNAMASPSFRLEGGTVRMTGTQP